MSQIQLSFRRKPESRDYWTPASAGVTECLKLKRRTHEKIITEKRLYLS
jgi:hypothetical protein